jgi:predicted DNA-binding transcriptional regulator AlpA
MKPRPPIDIQERVDDLRRRIAGAGGLVNAADMARDWGVSRERIRQLVELADFPEPIGHAGVRPVWLAEQVADWRAQRAARVAARARS